MDSADCAHGTHTHTHSSQHILTVSRTERSRAREATDDRLRAGINTTNAHIGQYDKWFSLVLVIADILISHILVIGNMY